MESEINNLKTIINKKYKAHLVTKIVGCIGLLSTILSFLPVFGIKIVWLTALGWNGFIIIIAICICVILFDFIFYCIKKYNIVLNQIKLMKCLNTGCKYKLITEGFELVKMNTEIVSNAKKGIYTTGSRSRDRAYLKSIEKRIAEDDKFIYYRVLYGPPHKQLLKKHLEAVIDIRDPKTRPNGIKTIFLGMYDDHIKEPEKFVCANEQMALVVIPSLLKVGNYDAAIVFYEKEIVEKLCNYVRDLYNCTGGNIEDRNSIRKLKVINDEV